MIYGLGNHNGLVVRIGELLSRSYEPFTPHVLGPEEIVEYTCPRGRGPHGQSLDTRPASRRNRRPCPCLHMLRGMPRQALPRVIAVQVLSRSPLCSAGALAPLPHARRRTPPSHRSHHT